ncbi:MAG: VOC family protein [Rudaea sp.]
MHLRKSTPVLIVDTIEPALAFWRDRLHFSVTVEVPHAGTLGFVILANDRIEVMYQSAASVRSDAHAPMHWNHDRSYLYVDVDDVDAVARALVGFEIVLPRRQTFYGATEIAFREPGGHFVTFAQIASD